MHYSDNCFFKAICSENLQQNMKWASGVHKHMCASSMITCKCWHLKVTISSLLQNPNASRLHVARPPPMPPSHDYHMAGKWNTGQFYSQINVQKGVLHLLSTELIRTENAPVFMIQPKRTQRSTEQSQYRQQHQEIKRTYYLRSPVTNPMKNNLSKPPLTQDCMFVRTKIGIMY